MSERLNVLQIAQRAMASIGMPNPSSVVSTSDDTSRQLMQCLYETAEDMIRSYDWQVLRTLGTFTTVAQEDQGDIYTKFPSWRRIINDTAWNTTTDRKLVGPVTSQIWREASATGRTYVANSMFRIFGDHFYILGQDTASETIELEYISSYWLKTADGLTSKETITANTDICKLHGQTMVLGVQALWLHKSGQDSTAAAAEYDRSKQVKMGEDGGKPIISLAPPASRRMDYPYDVTVRNYS